MPTSYLLRNLFRSPCLLFRRQLFYWKRWNCARTDTLVCPPVDDIANRVSVIAEAVGNFLHRDARVVLFTNGQHSVPMQLFTHVISITHATRHPHTAFTFITLARPSSLLHLPSLSALLATLVHTARHRAKGFPKIAADPRVIYT